MGILKTGRDYYGCSNQVKDPVGEPVTFTRINPMLMYLFYIRINVFFQEYFNYLIQMLIRMAKRKKDLSRILI